MDLKDRLILKKRDRVMKFLDNLCDGYKDVTIEIYDGHYFSFPEIRAQIINRTKHTQRLYKAIENLYEATLRTKRPY